MEISAFCGSQFWDLNQTWYTNEPDLTPCFEATVFVWIPCGFLWLFAALDFYYSTTSRARSVPTSPLNVTKFIFSLCLIAFQIYDLVLAIVDQSGGTFVVYPVAVYTPIIKIVTYAIYLFLLQFSKSRGVQSSGVQFIFWFLHFLCETFTFRTQLLHQNLPNDGTTTLSFIIHVIDYPLVVGNLLLNCWADLRPDYEQAPNLKERPCPEYGSSYLNRLLYSWFDGLAWKGFRKPLEYSDLWALNTDDTSRAIVPLFDYYWARDLDPSRRKMAKKSAEPSEGKIKNSTHSAEFIQKSDTKKQTGASTPTTVELSVVPALIGAFGQTFIFGASLKIIPDLLAFVNPQVLSLLIDFVNDSQAQQWKGIAYAILLFVSAFFQTIFMAQYSHRMYLSGMRVRTALVSAIYRKALLVSNASKKESTVGEIVNLMSVDVQRLMDAIAFVNYGWSAPFQIAIAVYFLYAELGPSVFSGLAIMVLMIPINSVIASKVRKLQLTQMKNKDQRVKMMNEILSGVKVLKLYAWEPSFQDQVMEIREKEMQTLRSTAYLNAITNFLWTCAPFLVAVFTFATYVLSDEKNVLNPQKAFVSLSLFNIMTFPLTILPMVIIMCVQAWVSVGRLNRYMNTDELSPDAMTHDETEADPIIMENGSFAWEAETTVLRNINLRVKEGSLIAVVGTVGSGKSSLLSAMLGELQKLNGKVNTKGTIAYVAQQAWIQNATVRNNILFGRPYESLKYNKIIEACALEPDLDILPGRDQTEIGEKGINLSGGQKQRISVARATYNNADVYLLDDPLSAVDSHVGKHMFDRVLGPRGLLKRKTRVLVTHGISFLPQVDEIIVMKDGEISEVGSYQALLDRKGAFAEFLMHHITEDPELDPSDMDPNILKDIEGVVGNLDQLRQQKRKASKKSSQKSTGGGTAGGGDMSESDGGTITELSGHHRRFSSASRDGGGGDRRESMRAHGGGKSTLIDAEKTETESVRMSVYLDYFRAAGWPMTIATFFLYLLFQAFSVGSNLWLSAWSNEPVVNGTIDTGKRDMYLAVYGVLGILQAIFVFAGTLVMTLGTLKSSARFHWVMLRSILRSPMWFFDTTPVGRIVNRFAKDVDMADNALPLNIRLWLNQFFQVVATIFIIAYSTPIFTAVILPVGILYYLVQRFYVSTSRQLKRLESVTRSPIYSHFSETISGAPTIRAYGEQDRFILESEAKVDHNQVSYFPAIVSNRWLAVRLETVGNLVIFFAALFAVLGRETLNPGMVGLSVSYALQITIALNMLVRWTSDVETNIVAIERLQEYVDAPQEAAWEMPNKRPHKNWPQEGVVEFNGYQTRYREGLDLVLRNVTCKIEGGEKIGIVGRTGAGKSSLTLALFRIVEAAGGSITIDGENIAKLGLHDVRGRLTIIPQDPVLFSGTLRVNLDPFDKYSDETIWRALELAHLKAYAKGLASGLQHAISEGGENLSVGQRQLVCLARALLRRTKVLILDEATAAVDLETDDLIQQTIKEEFKDSTVITIAHRLNTIMDSTRVMVLDNGEIREFDSPQNLLQTKNSLFYDMAKDAGLV